MLLPAAAACQQAEAPDPIVETVIAEVTVEVPVTVEVTRIVEVETVEEVEREVEVTRVVERVVERVVTATPEPTAETTATPEPSPTATTGASAPPPLSSTMLQAMRGTRSDMETFGGMIDSAINSGSISCQDVVDTYDTIVAAPTFNTAGQSDTIVNAYNNYRTAVSGVANGAEEMTQNCRDALVNPGGTTIPFQQWGAARQVVSDAVELLNGAIRALEG